MFGAVLKIFRDKDFPHMIEDVSNMLKPLTIHVDSRNMKRCPLTYIIIVGVLTANFIYVFFISSIWFVFWRCKQLRSCDLDTGAINFSLGVACNSGAAKLLFIFFNQTAVRHILDGYMACNALVVPGSRFSDNLRDTLKGVKKRITLLWVTIVIDGFLYVFVKPAVMPGKHLVEDKQVLLGFEPPFKSPNYEISLIMVGCGINYICYVCITTWTLFMTMTGYTEAQMVALSLELTHLWDDAQNHYVKVNQKTGDIRVSTEAVKNKIMNQYVQRHLIDLVQRHTMNVDLLRRLESVFRGALVTEFILLISGLIAELLGGLEHTYLQVPYTFLQAAIDCWTGQLLINASEMFENAVYNCKWENFNAANMKMVLLMLQNSQRSLKLSAGGIATLNYSSLMYIIKSIFSTYTALRSTMKS